MSKKIIIIIGVAVLILLVFLGYAFLAKPNTNSLGQSSGTNFFSSIFPFFKSKTNTNTPSVPANISGSDTTTAQAVTPERLKKVSSFPIAGYGVFMKERFINIPEVIPPTPTPTTETGTPTLPLSADTKTTNSTATESVKTSKTSTKPTPPTTEKIPALRYVERATGNIYQTFADQLDERKFSSKIIPQVYEAYFGNNSDSVAMRYLKNDNQTIQTFISNLPKEVLGQDTTGDNTVDGVFLPENVTDMSISPDKLNLFYLFNVGNGSVGITANSSGNLKTQIFNSPFTEWLSFWPNNRMITLTTKPSYATPGYMYAIDPIKKDFNKIIGGINGLTTLTSPDGKKVLYANSSLSLSILDIDTRTSVALGIKTLPDKCVWNKTSEFVYCAVPNSVPSGQYPDSWYQGEVSFSDDIWQVNAQTGNGLIILIPSLITGGESIDAIKLGLDDNENYLFFVNKTDSYLWEFEL